MHLEKKGNDGDDSKWGLDSREYSCTTFFGAGLWQDEGKQEPGEPRSALPSPTVVQSSGHFRDVRLEKGSNKSETHQ